MSEAAYDRMGIGYSAARRPEPRIAARIEAALGDAGSVLNVGAGTGSYEPAGREVTALEPSREMIAQRPPGSAPVIEGVAEDLPFDDDSFDAAMALITVHHWSDRETGLAEMVRVARRRVVVLTLTPVPPEEPWMKRASSSWHQMPSDEVERGLAKLRADLESGRWDERNGHLREQPELDVGLRLVTAELR